MLHLFAAQTIYCNTYHAGQGGKYVEENRQRQQRRSQADRIRQQARYGAQRDFDQEVGAFGPGNEYLNDLNTDYEIGGLSGNLDTGLNADYEFGDLGQVYEFPVDEQPRRKNLASRRERTQRRQNDR